MFGHLKAHDFVNLMEGAIPVARHQAHIEACERCRTTWQSLKPLHAEIERMDSDIPEPDWAQFRASVRDQLLSRSIQRDSLLRRWTGWTFRPALAWALSLLFVAGLMTVTVLWRTEHQRTPPAVVDSFSLQPAEAVIDAGPDRHVFDDVLSLGDDEQEQLSQMLEASQAPAVPR